MKEKIGKLISVSINQSVDQIKCISLLKFCKLHGYIPYLHDISLIVKVQTSVKL